MKEMAPEIQTVGPVTAATPRREWGEREVRRLLRGLRRPHTLAMEPLARFLCDIYAIENPYDSSLRFIADTFVNGGLVGKRLFELIQTCDVQANETLVAAASEMGVSPRQFFRYRREAIVALAAHANRLGRPHDAIKNPMEELARLLGETDPAAASQVYAIAAPAAGHVTMERVEVLLNAGEFFGNDVLDRFYGTERLRVLIKIARACYIFGNPRAGEALLDAVRDGMSDAIVENREGLAFDLLYTRYIRALHRGDASECSALAGDARRAAKGDEMRTIAAILIEGESAVRAGNLPLAEQTLTAVEAMVLRRTQLRLVTVAICLRAAIAFMRDDLARAYGYIHSAQLALHERPLDAMTINALIGRVSLAMGTPWRAPRNLLEVAEPPIRTLVPASGAGFVGLDGSTRRLFPRLYLKIVDLRAALAAGEIGVIDEIVEALALARQAGYRSLEACALGVLARWHARAGDSGEAQSSAIKAWTIVTDLGDFYAAHDLFTGAEGTDREFGAVDLDDEFLAAFYQSLEQRFPGAVLVGASNDASKNRFWRSLLLASRRNARVQADEDQAFLNSIAAQRDAAACHKQRTPFVRAAARDAAIFLPPAERHAFIARLTRALEISYEQLPGGASRLKRPQF